MNHQGGMSDTEQKGTDENSRADRQNRTLVLEENTVLLLEIAQLCNRPDRKNQDVIFLLGQSGVGKSTMVNTINKALCGKHFLKAKTGKGIASSNTFTLQWYDHCGVEEFEPEGLHKDALNTCLDMLPNIIDAGGNADEHSRELREILKMVFAGFIPPGTSIDFLHDQLKQRGTGCLKRLYINCHEEWKVTKVVFVASCTQALPTRLIECLHEVLRLYDKRTGFPKFDIDVFVAITKYDLVEEESRFTTAGSEKKINMETFQEQEREVAKHFNIDGSLKHNSIRWVSYVDGHNEDNPFIDNIALKFVKQMMRPRRSKNNVENKPPQVLFWHERVGRKVEKYLKAANVDMKTALSILLGAITIVAILYLQAIV